VLHILLIMIVFLIGAAAGMLIEKHSTTRLPTTRTRWDDAHYAIRKTHGTHDKFCQCASCVGLRKLYYTEQEQGLRVFGGTMGVGYSYTPDGQIDMYERSILGSHPYMTDEARKEQLKQMPPGEGARL